MVTLIISEDTPHPCSSTKLGHGPPAVIASCLQRGHSGHRSCANWAKSA